MKLITDDVMREAQRIAIKSRADDIEKCVIKKFQNAIIHPNVEEKLVMLLNNNPNADLSQSSIIRNTQTIVNNAFKNRNDYKQFTKSVYEAMELLALSLVVADEDNTKIGTNP